MTQTNKHSTRRAQCRLTAFDELECLIPYHPALIADWKAAIPFRWRSFDPDSKAWRFWGGYQHLAIALLLQCFPEAEVPRGSRTRITVVTEPTGDGHFASLHLLPSAPRALIDAAYRTLARLHHPDVGDDPKAMRALNEAHNALKDSVLV
jgi:hypothetical protein